MAFCSSISISMTSLSVVSEIAMVPESECRMPTLMVSSWAEALPIAAPARHAANAIGRTVLRMMPSMIPP